jgi:hypothetical protein
LPENVLISKFLPVSIPARPMSHVPLVTVGVIGAIVAQVVCALAKFEISKTHKTKISSNVKRATTPNKEIFIAILFKM